MVEKARASAQGLERVEERLRKLGWTKYDQQWRKKAGVSESTLKRFWKPEDVKRDTFIKICEALEVDWKTIIAESNQSEGLVVGQTICDRYKILKLRSNKKHCRTYLAEDLQLDLSDSQKFPKCLITQLSHNSSEKAQELLEREARTLHQVRQHTQIPQLYAYFKNNKDSYLIKEYIEGNPLEEEIIEGQPWSETDVINFLSEMLEILSFVHKRKVIHRKINLKNILRRESDQKLVLVHFREITYDDHSISSVYPSLLDGTTSQYSPWFIAPEQGMGLPESSSDLYSLGRIAIQMLTGKPLDKIRIEYETANIRWHDSLNINCQLIEFIDTMVKFNPQERHESTTTALKEFKQAFIK
ncbi:MAG: protein kinase [Crocosphaera sp.]|nr:protein kinase [Crocosphaera sp.]